MRKGRRRRKKYSREIRTRLAEHPPTGRTLVLGSAEWPPGVVGIAASRVQQDLYYAPVVIFSIDEGKGIARGSARSIPGFDVHHALSMCAELLIKWGGHKAAAGLTIAADRIEEFADRFEEIAQAVSGGNFHPARESRFGITFGPGRTRTGPGSGGTRTSRDGQPGPAFLPCAASGSTLSKIFGKEQNHLKLEFENGLEGIWWRGAQRFPEISEDRKSCTTVRGRLWIWFSTSAGMASIKRRCSRSGISEGSFKA